MRYLDINSRGASAQTEEATVREAKDCNERCWDKPRALNRTLTWRGLTGGGGRVEGARAAGAAVVGSCWWSECWGCQGSPVRPNVPCSCCCTCCWACCWCCSCCWLLLCSTVGVTRGSAEATEEIFRTVCEMSDWLFGSYFFGSVNLNYDSNFRTWIRR